MSSSFAEEYMAVESGSLLQATWHYELVNVRREIIMPPLHHPTVLQLPSTIIHGL